MFSEIIQIQDKWGSRINLSRICSYYSYKNGADTFYLAIYYGGESHVHYEYPRGTEEEFRQDIALIDEMMGIKKENKPETA